MSKTIRVTFLPPPTFSKSRLKPNQAEHYPAAQNFYSTITGHELCLSKKQSCFSLEYHWHWLGLVAQYLAARQGMRQAVVASNIKMCTMTCIMTINFLQNDLDNDFHNNLNNKIENYMFNDLNKGSRIKKKEEMTHLRPAQFWHSSLMGWKWYFQKQLMIQFQPRP